MIKYWIYSGMGIGALSFFLYSVEYAPSKSDLTAVVFHVDSIFPGYPAMRGAIDGIDTSTFITIAILLFMVRQHKRYLRSFVLITGILLIVLMMKRTGLLMLATGGLLFCIFAVVERRYAVTALVPVLLLGLVATFYDFLIPPPGLTFSGKSATCSKTGRSSDTGLPQRKTL